MIWRRLLETLLVLMMAMPALSGADFIPPDVLARNATNEVIDIVRQDRDIKGGDSQKIYGLVETRILPHFDFRHMTQLAVGKHWPNATPEQQKSLIDEFRALLVRTYAASLSSVADYRIEFKPLRMRPGDDDVTVSTEVLKSGAPPITIDYRMEKQTSGWKVYDVAVDNVSLVTVYRNSFNSEVRKGGIDGLIASLARRNQRN